jgi:hypothetical protein|tara:strand:+ start:1867 stop:2079 length:213 start_codon:yes stop_codon:yes gene_type:complete
MKETVQQECAACEQVITLSQPDPNVVYCLSCVNEINAWHDQGSRVAMSEIMGEAFASQYDNDPNPYHGDY